MKDLAPWLGIVVLAATMLVQWGQQAERVDNLREVHEKQTRENERRDEAAARASKELIDELTKLRIVVAELKTEIATSNRKKR